MPSPLRRINFKKSKEPTKKETQVILILPKIKLLSLDNIKYTYERSEPKQLTASFFLSFLLLYDNKKSVSCPEQQGCYEKRRAVRWKAICSGIQINS